MHDVGPFGDGVFLAMEFIDGPTLAVWSRARARSRDELLAAFLAAADGLLAAHAAGLVHSDFKPSNVMIGADGRVRVTDFGLARSEGRTPPRFAETASVATPTVTRAGVVVGTPAYMAPEQFAGAPVDHRVDQFALCVALWEALCGRRPFAGDSVSALRRAVASGAIEAGPETAAMPPWIRRALLRGLATRPEDRFPTMGALAEALRADPRPRRRVALALGGLALSLALILGAGQLARRAALAECRAAGEAVALDDDTITAIERSFAGRALPFAATSLARIRVGLDAWTDAWARARTEVCVAALDEALPRELAAAQVACLEDQEEQLAGLAQLLAAADDEIVRDAVSAVARLPRPDACARPEALARYRDLEAGARDADVSALRRGLSRVEGLLRAERNREAARAAEVALEQARALGRPRLVHRAQLALGQALLGLGEHEEARARLRDAHYGALAAGVDLEALDAAIALIGANARLHAEYEPARRWAATADALARRLGIEGSGVDARRLDELGNLRSFEGDHAAAAAAYQRAYALRVETLPKGHPDLASSLTNLGNVASAAGDGETARAHYERALELQRESLGADHPHVARALINLGNLELRAGRYYEAVARYESAGALLRPLGEADYEATVALQNKAAALYYLGEHEQALRAWERVLELRSAQLPASSPEIGELLVNIATCRGSLGDVEGAIAGLRRALAIFEGSFGPEDARVAVVLNNLGGFEADAGRPDEAVTLRRRALALHVRNHGPDSQEAAHAHVTIARVLVGMGRVDEARVELAAARRFYDREPGYQLGERSLEMTEGRLLWLEGQHARARLHLLALRERILRDRSKSDVLALIATWFAEHGGPPTADELEVVTRALDASDAGVTRGAALDPG